MPTLFDVEPQPDFTCLAGRFHVYPFSIMDTKRGDWKKRKRAWISMGIKSEEGRGEGGKNYSYHQASLNRVLMDGNKGTIGESGISVFDPVLCEIAYRWFCPLGGAILDPFAGGSVRGTVAALLGHRYTGMDLTEKQVIANRQQWEAMKEKGDCKRFMISCMGRDPATMVDPVWVHGDSRNIRKTVSGKFDFAFTCPPYGSVEKYSDKEEDLSNKKYAEFLCMFEEIIAGTAKKLRQDSFFGIVVGDFREKDVLVGFPTDTVNVFRKCGLELYNDCIYHNPIGSVPIRTSHQFDMSLKIGRLHQYFYVFVKGDPKKAADKVTQHWGKKSEQE